jgi:predicted nucleic acid-binding protein
MYLDTAYIAKFYLNEPESMRVRELVREARVVHSSIWALAEFHSVLHRRVREQALSSAVAKEIEARFFEHVEDQLWRLVPLHEGLLRRTANLILSVPEDVFIRAGDAVHLATAVELGEHEVWTNDRHMIAAAAHFGLTARSVAVEWK